MIQHLCMMQYCRVKEYNLNHTRGVTDTGMAACPGSVR